MTPKQRFIERLEDLRSRLTTDWQGDGVRVTEAVAIAVDEVLAELHRSRSNWYLIATLLSSKSYLCGALVEEEPFCEDLENNREVVGEGVSVYTIMDGLQFRAALLAGVMPAGMTAYTAAGKEEEQYPHDGDSHTMRNIAIADRRVSERHDGPTAAAEDGDLRCKPK